MMNDIRSNLHNTINNIPDNLLIIGTGHPVLQPNIPAEQENINPPIPASDLPVPEQENIDPSRDNISVLISRVNRINRLHRLQRLQRANEIRMREQALREEEERQIQQAIELSFHN